MAHISNTPVVMPGACRKCGALRGALVDGKIVCACGADRGALSDATTRFVASVITHFGAPKEAIVLRKSDVAAKIKEHDNFLRRKFAFHQAKSWFELIEQAAVGNADGD